MNLFQRIVKYVTPPCGHEDELHALRNQVQAAKLARELAEREQRVIERARQRALAELEGLRCEHATTETELIETTMQLHELERLVFEEHPAGAEYVGAVLSLGMQRALTAQALADVAAAVEEATGRVAILEQELREAKAAGFRAQTSFVEPPPEGEELPIPDEEVIADNVVELAYRLVGLYFEGRQHWILARGDERIKAPIHDAAWLEQMRRGEVQFRAGDTMVAKFRVVTYRRGADKVWAEQSVEQVLRVIHADEQVSLPLGSTEVAHA